MQKLALKQQSRQLKAKISYKMEIVLVQKRVPSKELSHVQHKSKNTKNTKNKNTLKLMCTRTIQLFQKVSLQFIN